MFNHSDPTLWSLCLRAATGKQEDPTDLIKSLWQGFNRFVIKDTIKFFCEAKKRVERKMLQRKMRKRRERRFPLKQTNFELLALYAAASQANSTSLRSKNNYVQWRRRHYPLGLVHDPQTQMVLPLGVETKKKAASVLFEVEVKLRNQLGEVAVKQAAYRQAAAYKQQASYV